MRSRTHRFLLLTLLVSLVGFLGAAPAVAAERDSYVVVFKDSVTAPGELARSQAEERGGKLGFVYSHAIKGYSVELPEQAVEGLRHNPQVDYVLRDGPVELFEEEEEEEEVELETENSEGPEIFEVTIPTGISRTYATVNKALDIDSQDDVRADVDVAVLDTGINLSHPELNVVGRTNCVVFGSTTCVDNSGADGNSHGTHVAGTIAALDNNVGVVGMAPGARLWAVKVLNDSGSGSWSRIIAGIDWVSAHASQIEVANMSLGGKISYLPLEEALKKSTEAGVVYAVAAGNQNMDAKEFAPANVKFLLTVSAIADYDGLPGEKAAYTCGNYGPDDQKASFSNYGPVIDIAAPGVCILSTMLSSSYGLKSGTSMASPHVAGAAALLAAKENPNSTEDVYTIQNTLKTTGNYNWTDTSGDGVKEPLLSVSNETIYSIVSPPAVTTGPVTYTGTGTGTQTLATGTVNPEGLSTTYQFEYVSAAKYNPEATNPYAEGSKAPVSAATLGSTKDEATEVKEALSGLEPGTLYHYRLVAENSKGLTKGSDQTFTHLPLCKGTEGQCAWSLQSPANPQPQSENELEDISCADPTMCMAVGNDYYRGKGFSEVWNGSEWKVLDTFEGEMKSISCPSTTWCMTVAKTDAKGWQLKWVEIIFGSWSSSAKAPPTPEGATEVKLNDVSCTDESACTVVGRYYNGGYKPYAARWNGSAWTLQTAASPSEGSASEALLGVSCASSTYCVAVGTAAGKPFVERWNGSEWATQSAPNPEGATEATLEGVSCTSSSACMAVGNSKGSGSRKTLTERWNGSKWSVVASPTPSEKHGRLRSVHCWSGSSCIAVGVLTPTSLWTQGETTLAESWNGTEWTVQSSLNVEGNLYTSLAAVSCGATANCTAVGTTRPASAQTSKVTLAQRWNGEKWSLQSAANPQPQSENELEDVACPSATLCLAVGNDYYRDKGFWEVWNGSEWKISTASLSELKAISCPTTSWCMTVAKAENSAWQLKESGGSWSATAKAPPTPAGATEVKLNDVSCSSDSACTVVGRYYNGGYKPYVARWNGSAWTQQTAPSPSEGNASEAMLSVSCPSASFCMAVGRAANKPFAERWDGSAWATQSAPNPEGATEATLEGISCASASACMAVGNHKGSGSRKTLAQRWNGSTWSVIASPTPSEKQGRLRSISCLSASSCIAVGVLTPTSFLTPGETTLAESWNGTEWTVQSTPNAEGNLYSSFAAVSCTSPVACTAVGATRPSSEPTNKVTLAARWQ